jgi:hypothetical protein
MTGKSYRPLSYVTPVFRWGVKYAGRLKGCKIFLCKQFFSVIKGRKYEMFGQQRESTVCYIIKSEVRRLNGIHVLYEKLREGEEYQINKRNCTEG